MDAGVEALQGQREVDRVDIVQVMASETKRVSAVAAIRMAVSSAWRDVITGFVAIERPIGGRPGLPPRNARTVRFYLLVHC